MWLSFLILWTFKIINIYNSFKFPIWCETLHHSLYSNLSSQNCVFRPDFLDLPQSFLKISQTSLRNLPGFLPPPPPPPCSLHTHQIRSGTPASLFIQLRHSPKTWRGIFALVDSLRSSPGLPLSVCARRI